VPLPLRTPLAGAAHVTEAASFAWDVYAWDGVFPTSMRPPIRACAVHPPWVSISSGTAQRDLALTIRAPVGFSEIKER
jgi:hypothetical protein